MGKTVTVRHFMKELQLKDPEFPTTYISCKSTMRSSVKATYGSRTYTKCDAVDVLAQKGRMVFIDDVQNVRPETFNIDMKYFYDTYRDKSLPILMCNIPFYGLKKMFTEEVLSRMSWPLGTFIGFPDYSLNDIYQILIQRAGEALEPGSWQDDAILTCAKYGAENKDLTSTVTITLNQFEGR